MKYTFNQLQAHLKKFKRATITNVHSNFQYIYIECKDNSELRIDFSEIWRIYLNGELYLSFLDTSYFDEYLAKLLNRKITSMKINKTTLDLIIKVSDGYEIHLLAMNLSSAWNVDKILNYANMRELFRVK
jgi:hypothetical protein